MKTLPVPACVYMVGAIDALKLADEALGVAADQLEGMELAARTQLDACDLAGIQETVRVFIGILADAADGARVPLGFQAVRRCIEERETALQRSECALSFAVANLAEVLDALDEIGDAEEWYGRCLAAHTTLELLHSAIDTRRPRSGFEPGMN